MERKKNESEFGSREAWEVGSASGRFVSSSLEPAGLCRDSHRHRDVESDFLRGVLEFSSESLLPLDEHVFRAIANVGFQLGQVFTRERLEREHGRDHDQMRSRDSRHVATAILAGETFRATVVTSCELLTKTYGATSALSNELLESTRQMRQHLDEFKRLTAKPTPLLPNPTS